MRFGPAGTDSAEISIPAVKYKFEVGFGIGCPARTRGHVAAGSRSRIPGTQFRGFCYRISRIFCCSLNRFN